MGNTQIAQYSNRLFTGAAGKEFTIFEEAYYDSKDMPGGTNRLSVYTTNGGHGEYDFTADIHD